MKPMKLYHILHFEKACILSCHVFLGLHRVHLREKKGSEYKRGEIFQSLFNLHWKERQDIKKYSTNQGGDLTFILIHRETKNFKEKLLIMKTSQCLKCFQQYYPASSWQW